MVARFKAWMAHTPTWWISTIGTVLILIWLVLDFIAVMTERPDSFAWILGGIGLEVLALGNLIPPFVSSPGGDQTAVGEGDRAHWRGVAEACFGLVIIGIQLLPEGPVAYALLACAAWVCFLSVLAFALRWRWPLRGDGDRRIRV